MIAILKDIWSGALPVREIPSLLNYICPELFFMAVYFVSIILSFLTGIYLATLMDALIGTP
ncbi:MAG: hypothetical protein IMZ50_02725 [Candidatus Atribacteria bacterium]|nr:hypothetical protein [Candidatus Atribacteria bacterium]